MPAKWCAAAMPPTRRRCRPPPSAPGPCGCSAAGARSRACALIALPPAGGNAGTFRGWDARLPADVELLAIQYPGRQERQDEPFVTDVEAMLCAIDDALLPLLDRPFALVGASLGGMLAYELAARLESLHGLRARQLFVISSRARGRTWNTRASMRWATPSCCEPLREYDVLPLEVLDDPELREISLATLRADSRLAADYRYRPREPLAIPITAILGEQDPRLQGGHRRLAAARQPLRAGDPGRRPRPGGDGGGGLRDPAAAPGARCAWRRAGEPGT